MSQFDDREQAFEKKFAHDEELKFKATARRNKLLGLWAAELMGLSGEAAGQYAKKVVKADFEEAGEEDVYRKIKGDLDAKGLDVSEHRVRKAMADLMEEAKRQIWSETK
ncbi:MAG TPA: DUF1476 domain-containing protein [Sphingomonadales bacterium]|nr:DUF1476 domain-containing protein [Sphingomonadales bacterium]